MITYDPAKSERNARERGLPFWLAGYFDFASAIYHLDARRDYGERRIRAIGRFRNGNRLHVLVFVGESGSVRVISLRRANRREVKIYESKARS